MKRGLLLSAALALWLLCAAPVRAEEIAISYPGLSGDSASLWMAGEGGFFKENGVNAKLVYIEGGRLSIQSLLSGHTQFMSGDAVSALSAVAAGADIVLLGSAKNVLPYVFAVTKQVQRIQDVKGKVVGISQIGGRAGEIARMVIKNNGLDPDKDVIYLAVGGTMSRLAALAAGKVQAAPISKGVVTAAQDKGLQIIEVEPIPLIIDALWTTRKYAEENAGLVYRVMRSYVAGIATIIKDRPKSIVALRRYMRTADAKTLDGAYESYVNGLDRVPIPNERAVQNTLEITYRIAPKLAGLGIKKQLYFGAVERLRDEGFIDRLYK